MAEYTETNVQIVNPGEVILFSETPVPCTRGFVKHREGSGNFLLSGWTPNKMGCCCNRDRSANYLVSFGANISVPDGGTADAISVAISIDGSVIPSSEMIVTPAAEDEYFNVARTLNVQVWNGCCETVSVRNTSDQAIQVSNANILFSRPDLAVTY